ncbi:MAG: acyltransferase [Gammaproteobacteria bacterium]|nr:acyltransferase [Gammaproteobacteria bacterium]
MNRIESVDVFRLIAIVAVIAIHTTPFRYAENTGGDLYKYLDLLINQASRFAVPFFFIISGYFWGMKIRRGDDVYQVSLSMSKRIFFIFLAWSFIYLLPLNIGAIVEFGLSGPFDLAYNNWSNLIHDPVRLIFEGSRVHLWYLTSLIISLLITAFLVAKNLSKTLLVTALFLYVVGVLAKAYVDTPIGIQLDFNTRNGPFFGMLLFVSGYLLSARQSNEKWFYYGFGLFLLGFVLHFTEIFMVWTRFETSPRQDFVFGTFFMGFGVALAALSNHRWLRSPRLGRIGQLTLGIYAVHFLFVEILAPIEKRFDHVLWELSYVLIVLVLSIVVTLWMAKSRFLKKIVV